jgi:hypothetical protein
MSEVDALLDRLARQLEPGNERGVDPEGRGGEPTA